MVYGLVGIVLNLRMNSAWTYGVFAFFFFFSGERERERGAGQGSGEFARHE